MWASHSACSSVGEPVARGALRRSGMNGGKIDRVWVPDPVDGYRLGVVVDVGAESLTIKLQDSPQGVGLGGRFVYCLLL